MSDRAFWCGRRVLVTGHTGFKGSWLSTWLLRLGADVHGIALDPETEPSLFTQLGLSGEMDSKILDIRDADKLKNAVCKIAPDTVFHMAAQPLVRESYVNPLATWDINVMGTAHLLKAVSALSSPCAIVVVTTDKVYQNEEWDYPYRETDRLGGHDPYSASKAASELLVDSWRRSFFAGSKMFVASARAGNVVGGGDWNTDRILPDIVRTKQAHETLTLRNPGATRPWQHVLDPLNGYMMLAQSMVETDGAGQEAWNFGPEPAEDRTVEELVTEVQKRWHFSWKPDPDTRGPHEAGRLALTAAKAQNRLGWKPKFDFERTVAETIEWYSQAHDGECPRSLCETQIARHEEMQ